MIFDLVSDFRDYAYKEYIYQGDNLIIHLGKTQPEEDFQSLSDFEVDECEYYHFGFDE